MVESAQEMYEAVMARAGAADIFIGAAAVADYRPVAAADQKIKKTAGPLALDFERTPDILAEVAARPMLRSCRSLRGPSGAP